MTPADRPRPRRLATAQLTGSEVAAIRALMEAAFAADEDGSFSDDDWRHAIGGTHVLLDDGSAIVAHASVVEREIHVGEQGLRTGYVEAVATAPGRQGAGFGTIVMAGVGELIRERFELGVLGTGRHGFYERLGWTTWAGPSFVRTPAGLRRTPDEDGFLMVLRTPATPPLDDRAPISCDWRSGDVW